MCGRPLAFRQDCFLYWGYARFVGAEPQNSFVNRNGSAERLRKALHKKSAFKSANPTTENSPVPTNRDWVSSVALIRPLTLPGPLYQSAGRRFALPGPLNCFPTL